MAGRRRVRERLGEPLPAPGRAVVDRGQRRPRAEMPVPRVALFQPHGRMHLYPGPPRRRPGADRHQPHLSGGRAARPGLGHPRCRRPRRHPGARPRGLPAPVAAAGRHRSGGGGRRRAAWLRRRGGSAGGHGGRAAAAVHRHRGADVVRAAGGREPLCGPRCASRRSARIGPDRAPAPAPPPAVSGTRPGRGRVRRSAPCPVRARVRPTARGARRAPGTADIRSHGEPAGPRGPQVGSGDRRRRPRARRAGR